MTYDFLDSYKGKKILITGGTGYIGSSLVRALDPVSSRLVLLLREGRNFDEDWIGESRISLVRGDIRVRDTWVRALDGVDYVFHFATHESRYGVKPEPVLDLEVNVLPLLHLLEICRESQPSVKILFSGSENQVGVAPRIPVNETFDDNPVTIFGIHKLMSEKYLCHYASEFGLQTVTLRLSNVYGPTPRSTSAVQVVLNRIIRNALKGKVTIYGDGTFIRDYVFIEDVINAFLSAGSKMETVSGNHYLIGCGKGHQLVDAVNLIADRVVLKTGQQPILEHIPPPMGLSPFDKRNVVADTSCFCSATGWEPRVSLEEGIDRTIDYFLNDVTEKRI